MSTLPAFWLAVDGATPEAVMKKIEMIQGVEGDYGTKINLDLVMKNWWMIERVKHRTGKPLFVDTKMNNGKRTMSFVVKSLAAEGVAMTNAYALADQLLEEPAKLAREAGMAFLGLTVMTHHTDAYCLKFHGRSMGETVRMLAATALERGCSGYILPGTCLSNVTDLDGTKFNPAVRPPWVADKRANSQEQIATIQDAYAQGSHMVSCGSPVFDDPNPAEALGRILGEVQQYRVQ